MTSPQNQEQKEEVKLPTELGTEIIKQIRHQAILEFVERVKTNWPEKVEWEHFLQQSDRCEGLGFNAALRQSMEVIDQEAQKFKS